MKDQREKANVAERKKLFHKGEGPIIPEFALPSPRVKGKGKDNDKKKNTPTSSGGGMAAAKLTVAAIKPPCFFTNMHIIVKLHYHLANMVTNVVSLMIIYLIENLHY